MDININLKEKLKVLPRDIRYIAKELLSEVEKERKSIPQLEEMILDEIRELIAEEEE